MVSLSPLHHENSPSCIFCIVCDRINRPGDPDLWPLIGSWVTRVIGSNHANFGLHRPFCSRVRSRHGTDRWTQIYCPSFYNAPPMEGHYINYINDVQLTQTLIDSWKARHWIFLSLIFCVWLVSWFIEIYLWRAATRCTKVFGPSTTIQRINW